jgi:hypothetical protein
VAGIQTQNLLDCLVTPGNNRELNEYHSGYFPHIKADNARRLLLWCMQILY